MRKKSAAPAGRATKTKPAAPRPRAPVDAKAAPKTKPAAPRPRAQVDAQVDAKAAPETKPAARRVGGSAAPEAPDDCHVAVTPPELMRGEAAQLDARARFEATRPSPEVFAAAPWLSQARPFEAGYHVETVGLASRGHAEFELCNVPGAFLDAATRLLATLAEAVREGGRFDEGDVLEVVTEPDLGVVGFVDAQVDQRDGGSAAPRLRVVFVR